MGFWRTFWQSFKAAYRESYRETRFLKEIMREAEAEQKLLEAIQKYGISENERPPQAGKES